MFQNNNNMFSPFNNMIQNNNNMFPQGNKRNCIG